MPPPFFGHSWHFCGRNHPVPPGKSARLLPKQNRKTQISRAKRSLPRGHTIPLPAPDPACQTNTDILYNAILYGRHTGQKAGRPEKTVYDTRKPDRKRRTAGPHPLDTRHRSRHHHRQPVLQPAPAESHPARSGRNRFQDQRHHHDGPDRLCTRPALRRSAGRPLPPEKNHLHQLHPAHLFPARHRHGFRHLHHLGRLARDRYLFRHPANLRPHRLAILAPGTQKPQRGHRHVRPFDRHPCLPRHLGLRRRLAGLARHVLHRRRLNDRLRRHHPQGTARHPPELPGHLRQPDAFPRHPDQRLSGLKSLFPARRAGLRLVSGRMGIPGLQNGTGSLLRRQRHRRHPSDCAASPAP